MVGGPFEMVYSYFPQTVDDEAFTFLCYDVIIGGEIITTVPEDFIELFINEREDE